MANSIITYPHIAKEIKEVEDANYRVFFKLDGSNCQISFENDNLKFGTRKCIIDEKSNFKQFINLKRKEMFLKFFSKEENKKFILYGEFLCLFNINYDRKDNDYLIFDVLNKETNEYLDYDEYKSILDEFNIPYIEPIFEGLLKEIYLKLDDFKMMKSKYLKNPSTQDEGIVVKQKGTFKKEVKDQTMIKFVFEEFKDKRKIKKTDVGNYVEQYCTNAYLKKEIEKQLLNRENAFEGDLKLTLEEEENIKNDFLTSEIGNLNLDEHTKLKLTNVLMTKLYRILNKK